VPKMFLLILILYVPGITLRACNRLSQPGI